MTDTPTAEPAYPQDLELKCCELAPYKEKALALVAKDNSLHIIPFRSINKISTQSKGNPTSTVNGILVNYKIEDIMEVLEWDTKVVGSA